MKNSSILTCCLILSIIFVASCDTSSELSLSQPEVVTSGYRFTEGPMWLPDQSLIFSDIPANKIYQWRPGTSDSVVYIEDSGNSNGIDSLPGGTVVLAQHSGRVSKVTDSGALEPLATEYEGKRLNSPNDLAVRSDSMIYFTDPPFGVSLDDRELSFAGVYRLDPKGELTLMYDAFNLPNGIAFSPDEKILYVNDSETGRVIRFDVRENGDLTNEQLFVEIGESADNGAADGMITDMEGNLYTVGPNGLQVYDTEGKRRAQVTFDEQITNVAWGEPNVLYITAANAIYKVRVKHD